jgi:hypothetical protein
MAVDYRLVQADPKNSLGDKFDENRDYAVVSRRILSARLLDGWVVEVDVEGAGDEKLKLISRPRKV